MLDTASLYLSIAVLVAAIFFSLSALAGLLQLYLRHIDRLLLEKEDFLRILLQVRNALILFLMAWVAYRLPFPMSLTIFAGSLLATQLLRVNGLLKNLRNQR